MKTKWLVASVVAGLGLFFVLLCVAAQLPRASAAPIGRDARPGAGIPRPFTRALSPAAQTLGACGTITATTTWVAGNTYVANGCDVIVNAGVTLTIQAGATAKFSGTASALIVNGTLLAESNDVLQPINFTSFADDAHGMDVDGTPGSVGSPGQWFGLHFSAGSQGRLRNAFVGYAGSGTFNGHGAGWNVAQVRVVDADVQIRNTLVTAGRKTGIYIEGARVSPLLDTVQVSNNASGNPADPAYAIFQATINMTPTFRSLALTGNDANAVTIAWGNEAIQQNVTMGGSGAAYRFACHYTGCQQIIPDGKTFTIAPGTELQYDYPAYRIVVQTGGTLVAEGTAMQRITFTSAMTTPQAGNWEGIQVDANGSAHLAYCDVGYAGGYYRSIPALNTYTSDLRVHHTRFHDNGSDGVQIHGTNVAPVFEDVSILSSGGYGVMMGNDFGASLVKPTWDGGIISGSGKTGIFMSHYASAPQPIFRNLTIANNHGDGILIEWNGAIPTFENVAITGNTGAAVNQSPDSSPIFRNLTLSGNGVNAVVIPGGTLNGGRYWGAGGSPGLPYRVEGNITIPGNAFLSLEPGLTLRFITNTYLYARDDGALYALGTLDRPITLTRVPEASGVWEGVEIGQRAESILQNCNISYAGYGGYGGVYIWSTGFNVVQNCRIHHDSTIGIRVDTDTSSGRGPIIANNQIYSNTNYGVTKGYGGSVDARNNWWGDPSAPYHPTLNPGGKGNGINDERVIFSPWLTAPPTQTLGLGQVVVKTGGPRIVSPGQTTDYAIQYTSLMTRAVQNAVVMLQLPNNSKFLESSDGGLYWPERNQVFWRLGNLPAGANGIVSTRVRFNWGVTWGTRDGTVAILAGTNYGQTDLDVAPYLAHAPVSATGETPLTDAQVTAELAAYPTLKILFTRAISAGFAYRGWGGARYTLSSGQPVTQVVLLSPDRSATVFLRRRGTEIQATTMARTYYAVNDTTGGITINQQTRASQVWGSWAPGSAIHTAAPASGCSCLANCGIESAAGCIAGFGALGEAAGAWQCLTDPLSAGCASAVAHSVPVVGCLASAADCARDCAQDSGSHCCTGDQVGPPQGGWGLVTDFFGVNACQRRGCNTSTGNWDGVSRFTYCPTGQKCVAGKGCGCGTDGAVAAQTSSICAAGGSNNADCGDSDFWWARDPNAEYGPQGDLVPGQWVTYTITYENVGQGDAFGVFVSDQLNDSFDVSTLTAYPTTTSTFISSSRTVVWPVGQLGPKGTLTSTGAVSFAVRLKTNLPGGTLIFNQATVYFPSVPEETPTNPVVNVIQPVVAVPQNLQTNYRRPVTITLRGIEVSGLPLTFTLTQNPLNGVLGGHVPTLVYTPAANFSGLDRFAFKASNGITESRPAEVQIQVNPTGDTTPPQVQWTEPVRGAPNVPVQVTPAYTDTVGPVYAPFISVGFSEAISSTTVSTQSVQWRDAAGRTVPSAATYDGTLHQVVVAARQPLRVGTAYTVTVTRSVKDLAGNPLAANYSWSFRTGPPRYVYLPIVRRR